MLAWWQATLTEYPSTVPVDEVLAVVSQMTGDVEPWLTTWSTVGGVAAGRQLRDFVNAVLSWSYQIHDFDEEAAEQAIQRWLERDGVDIRFALAPGPELDTAFADLARRVTRGW